VCALPIGPYPYLVGTVCCLGTNLSLGQAQTLDTNEIRNLITNFVCYLDKGQ